MLITSVKKQVFSIRRHTGAHLGTVCIDLRPQIDRLCPPIVGMEADIDIATAKSGGSFSIIEQVAFIRSNERMSDVFSLEVDGF